MPPLLYHPNHMLTQQILPIQHKNPFQRRHCIAQLSIRHTKCPFNNNNFISSECFGVAKTICGFSVKFDKCFEFVAAEKCAVVVAKEVVKGFGELK